MATKKSTAAKKPAEGKAAAKKPAAKKEPAAKKPAVKKPAVKKPAAKKPAAKKPAAKKLPKLKQIDLGYFEMYQGPASAPDWVGVVNVTGLTSEDYFLFTNGGTTGGKRFAAYKWPSTTNTNVVTTFKYVQVAKTLPQIRTDLSAKGIQRNYIHATCTLAVHET